MMIRDHDKYIDIALRIGKPCRISVICAIAFLYITRYSFLSFATSFSLSTALVGGGMMIMFFLFFAYFTLTARKNIPWDGVLLVLSAILFFVVTIRVHPEYQYRYDDAFHGGRFSASHVFTFGAGIYTYYIIRLFKNSGDKLYSLFSVIAYVILFFDIWAAFFRRSEEYSMGFGYQMEIAAIVFLANYLEEKKGKTKLLLSIICMGMGVLYGSRACVIGYVVFAILYLLWKRRFELKLFFLCFMGLIGAIAINIPKFMRFVYDMFSRLGFQSRTLYLLSKGDIMATDTSRQDIIWPAVIKQLKSRPWYSGMGAYGDRTLYSTYYGYSHNIVLEMLATFGILLGGLFLIWMIVQFCKTIIYNRDKNGLMTLIFGCFALGKLFFSNTFWQEPFFWMFLASLINCSYHRKKRIRIVFNRHLFREIRKMRLKNE